MTPAPSSADPSSVAPPPVPPRSGRSARRRAAYAVLAGLVVVIAAATTYFAIPQPTLPEASAALVSTASVGFTRDDDRLVFRPANGSPSTGLILYPGGKVGPEAYAPAAAAIAERGYLVVIVPMPLNLAVLGIDRAETAIAAHPGIRRWAVGGHSLGGAMAAQYLAGHPGAAAGLVLWASYSATDISAQAVKVLVVYGSLDAGAANYVASKNLANLPPAPVILELPGGNHEQMGWYTGQPNDPPATISRADQQAKVVDATASLLESLGP